MRKLLIFSDLHITEKGSPIIGLDPGARFGAVLSHAMSHHPDAEGAILLGDLTHHGRTEQYQRLREILRPCPMPLWITLGNHDSPEAFDAVFPQQLGRQGFAQHSVKIGPAQLLVLDTHDHGGQAGAHAGWLCEERLAWLDAELRLAQGRPVLVACHHPPMPTGFVGMDAIRLANGAALMTRLRAYRGFVHLVCGHVHRTISGNCDGISYTILKSPCHQMPMRLGDPSSALSVDEPGAYGIALLHEQGVILHSQDVGLPGLVQRDDHSE